MQGALRPEAHEDIRSLWMKRKEEQATKVGVDPEDAALEALTKMDGWDILKRHIENLKIGLDKRLAESVLSSLGDNQIKKDALFAVLGKELLDSIINKVEDSALIVDDIVNERRGDKQDG